MKRYYLIFIAIILLLNGCPSSWKLIHTEELKGGDTEQSFADNEGKQRVIRKTRDGHVYSEIITRGNQPVSDIGWHRNNVKQHEQIFDKGKTVKDITWYPNGQKEREWVHDKKGICRKSFSWYISGQLAEENVFDEKGRYILAKRWYEESAKLKYEASFEEGEIKRQLFYNPDGTIDRSKTKPEMLQAQD